MKNPSDRFTRGQVVYQLFVNERGAFDALAYKVCSVGPRWIRIALIIGGRPDRQTRPALYGAMADTLFPTFREALEARLDTVRRAIGEQDYLQKEEVRLREALAGLTEESP